MDELLTRYVMTFGQLRFDSRQRELSRRDTEGVWVPVTVGSRALAILSALLREPGATVSKDALMDEVWPSTTVEANNLTVQIAALRRALDEGVGGESSIQTVPGRGYRFVGTVEEQDPGGTVVGAFSSEIVPPLVVAERSRIPVLWIAGAAAFALVCMLLTLTIRHHQGRPPPPPRLSLVVLPFQTFGSDPKDTYLAASVTDDLGNRLARFQMIPATVHLAGAAATDLTPAAALVKFDARFLLRGSVRRVGEALQVNAQLLATETGRTVWTDQVIASLDDRGAGQRDIVRRVAEAAGIQIIATEDERSRRERPNDPDGLDLVLHAVAISLLPPNAERQGQARDLLEHALRRDPSLYAARIWLVTMLLDGEDGIPRGRKAALERTRDLILTLDTIKPASWAIMLTKLRWLVWQGDRCPQTIDVAQRFIALYREFAQTYRWLGDCQTRIGLAQEALPALFEAAKLDEGRGWQAHDERNLQYAFLLLGRYDESISWGLRALDDNPADTRWERGHMEFRLAAAQSLAGRPDEAKRHLAAGLRLVPWTTLRQFEFGREIGPIYAAQLERVIEGLRLAGLPDHADEAADFGVPADDTIHENLVDRTPTTVPGANTIDTDALSALLAAKKPLVIDTLAFFAGRSIPGAVGLRLAGAGGNLTDVAQDHLRASVHELANGDLAKPLVAVGWNSQNFSGRNLALRLADLGYTNVYWYRGGREAWEARQLPEAELVATDW